MTKATKEKIGAAVRAAAAARRIKAAGHRSACEFCNREFDTRGLVTHEKSCKKKNPELGQIKRLMKGPLALLEHGKASSNGKTSHNGHGDFETLLNDYKDAAEELETAVVDLDNAKSQLIQWLETN